MDHDATTNGPIHPDSAAHVNSYSEVSASNGIAQPESAASTGARDRIIIEVLQRLSFDAYTHLVMGDDYYDLLEDLTASMVRDTTQELDWIGNKDLHVLCAVAYEFPATRLLVRAQMRRTYLSRAERADLETVIFDIRTDLGLSRYPPGLTSQPPVSYTPISSHDIVQETIPQLPRTACLDPTLAAQDSPWLDAYIAYSQRESPRGIETFHEAAGLWVLSTAAARRILLHLDKPLYPNLFIALVARTSVYAKTTTARQALKVLQKAGLEYLRAADNSTPPALIRALAGRFPVNYSTLSQEQQDLARYRFAFAGQRGWLYEEWGQHLAAMMRVDSPMADFHRLLRHLDDGSETYSNDSIARGLEEIERPYLALLVNATPRDLTPYLHPGSKLWSDGFWARFALLAPRPDEAPSKARRRPGTIPVPAELLLMLCQWHKALGIPEVSTGNTSDGKGIHAMRHRFPLHEYTLTPTAEDAYLAYDEAMQDWVIEEAIAEDFHGFYIRCASKAARIALLLASIESVRDDGTLGERQIELRHWARAQAIVERWRVCLHQLVATLNQQPIEPEERLQRRIEDRILAVIRKGKRTVRELHLTTHIDYQAIRHALNALTELGYIEPVETAKTTKSLPTGEQESYHNNRDDV